MKERQIRRNSTIQLINANDHVRDESRHGSLGKTGLNDINEAGKEGRFRMQMRPAIQSLGRSTSWRKLTVPVP